MKQRRWIGYENHDKDGWTVSLEVIHNGQRFAIRKHIDNFTIMTVINLADFIRFTKYTMMREMVCYMKGESQ